MASMVENILAALGAAVCIAMLVHMFLPAGPRHRIDAAFRRLGSQLRRPRGAPRPQRQGATIGKPPIVDRRAPRKSEREFQREAELEAQDVIDRVRRQAREGKPVERDGNVYRPDAFKPRPPRDKLH
jgi:hypothetical protein